jgi:hypothetical protein
VLGALIYPAALRAARALAAEDFDRARLLAERLPVSVRAAALALAAWLCRAQVSPAGEGREAGGSAAVKARW